MFPGGLLFGRRGFNLEEEMPHWLDFFLTWLKTPLAQNIFGPMSVAMFWASYLVKRRSLSYLLAFFTSIVTIAYSYSVGGLWFVLKWGVTLVISISQFFRYRKIDKIKAARSLKKLCDECNRG